MFSQIIRLTKKVSANHEADVEITIVENIGEHLLVNAKEKNEDSQWLIVPF